jgi:hypothetical protein
VTNCCNPAVRKNNITGEQERNGKTRVLAAFVNETDGFVRSCKQPYDAIWETRNRSVFLLSFSNLHQLLSARHIVQANITVFMASIRHVPGYNLSKECIVLGTAVVPRFLTQNSRWVLKIGFHFRYYKVSILILCKHVGPLKN